MIKLKIEGEPEEIAAFFFHLEETSGLTIEYKTDVSKRAEHHKWGSALAGIRAEPVEGLEAEFTIYAGKRGKAWNKADGKSGGKSAPGYVYLLPYYGPSGVQGYKIGKTANPYSRRKTFGVKFNFDVRFIALIRSSSYAALEKTLHQKYARRRRGASEWFDLSPDDVTAIQTMMSDDDKALLVKLGGIVSKEKSDD